MVQGLGFRFQGLEFRIEVFEFRIEELGFRVGRDVRAPPSHTCERLPNLYRGTSLMRKQGYLAHTKNAPFGFRA